MNRFLITLVCTFFINFLFSNTLEFTNAQINANDSGQIQLLLDNPNDQIGYLVILSEKKEYDLIFFELKHVKKSQEKHIFLFLS